MIKVALIGTHGTGKTQICHELGSELIKLGIPIDYIGETARKVPAWLEINEGTTLDAQEWILHTQIARELEARKDAVTLCDRGSIDNYAYLQRLFKKPVLDGLVKWHAGTYSLLLKVPINPDYLTYDGVRSINKPFQAEIDTILEKMLADFEIPFERYTNVESAIEKIVALWRRE